MLRAACIVALSLASPLASAEPPKADPLESNAVMTYDDPKDWIVSVRVFVFPDARFVGTGRFGGWTYTNFSMVLPYVTATGHGWLTDEPGEEPVLAALSLNGQPANMASIPTLTVPGTEAHYASVSVPGTIVFNAAEALISTRMTCVDTKFDQDAAWQVAWPSDEAAQALAPWLTRDPVYDLKLADGTDPVVEFVEKATDGNDPKKLPPAKLAKYMTACVLEHMRTTGSNRRSPMGTTSGGLRWAIDNINNTSGRPNASVVSHQNLFGGFVVSNAGDALIAEQGSEHDLVNVLTAVLRQAGLPARSVIGIDNNQTGDDEAKSWVEFALVVPGEERPVWVPIDLWELESDGRTTVNWEQTWKHFGTSDLLRDVVPVAHYFHPPADYRTYQLPAMFGIRSVGELPQYGSQALDFEVNSAPNRGGKPRRP